MISRWCLDAVLPVMPSEYQVGFQRSAAYQIPLTPFLVLKAVFSVLRPISIAPICLLFLILSLAPSCLGRNLEAWIL
jgi:hypothetical protein